MNIELSEKQVQTVLELLFEKNENLRTDLILAKIETGNLKYDLEREKANGDKAEQIED